MEGRSVFVFILSVLVFILILSGVGALVFHVINYDVPIYMFEEETIGNETFAEVVYSEAYIGKRDTNTFLEILALMILSLSIFYAGLLNYLKTPRLRRKE
ncbi:MAG: hypothetical protein ACFFB5_02035 [Promethearchaeota archaeon]